MGLDAEVNIWVGIACDGQVDLPEELFGQDGHMIYDKHEVERITGFADFRQFDCTDEVCGFGVRIFRHDWDFGVESIDLKALHEKAQTLIQPVTELFERWGIDNPVGVCIQTNLG